MYTIWRDAGIGIKDAATAARYDTNELHTSLANDLHTTLANELHTSLANELHTSILLSYTHPYQ